jgi:hypothetical protein
VVSRRTTLAAAAAAPWLAGCDVAAVKTFPTLASARQAIESLGGGWRHTGSFTLAQMLEHVAQSVEYSMRGFPAPKSVLFQATVGRAAFAVFDARGAMRHGLDEPIPGAPALALALDAAVARALQALQDFEAWPGPLAPHFAYGALDKGQYTRAHLMHLANHWTEVVRV